MSKLYNIYLELKKQDSNIIYLFKSGIFFIALDKDAYALSRIFHFKISNFTPDIQKCGFPCSSIEKYSKLFAAHNLQIKLIESEKNTSYALKEYTQSNATCELLNSIKTLDIESLSIHDAYEFLEKIQKIALEIG